MRNLVTALIVAALLLATTPWQPRSQAQTAPTCAVLMVAGVCITAGLFTVWLCKHSKDPHVVNCPARITLYACVDPRGDAGWAQIGQVVVLANSSTNWLQVFSVEIGDKPGYFFKVDIQPLVSQQEVAGWVVDAMGPLKINLGQSVGN